MQNKKTNMLVDAIAPTLFKMGAPMVFGIFFLLFFMLVDVFFIAQIGDKELAAVSFTIPVISFIDAIVLGFGVATTLVVSRILGKGDEDKAKRVGVHAVLLTLMIVSVICLIGQMTITPLFNFIGAMPELMPLIQGYMFFSYFALVTLVPPLVGNSIMRGAGNTMIPAIAMLMAAAVNAVLDPILIFGLLGAPKLGMNGAAIATIIARCVGFAFVLYNLVYRFHVFSALSKWRDGFISSAREILHTAIPAATANIIPSITALFLTGLIAHYGSEAVSAVGVATRIEILFYVPFFGVSAALGPFVGQNWGAKNYDRIKEAVKIATLFNVGWGIAVACILVVVGDKIIGLFSDDPHVTAIALQYFMIIPISYVAVGLIQVTASYLNATGKPRQAMLIPFIQFIGLILPLAYIGDHFYGLIAIFGAICLANFITGLSFYIRMRRSL